eukprot:4674439-Pyramimonas_sp.AAC.1
MESSAFRASDGMVEWAKCILGHSAQRFIGIEGGHGQVAARRSGICEWQTLCKALVRLGKVLWQRLHVQAYHYCSQGRLPLRYCSAGSGNVYCAEVPQAKGMGQ